MTSVPNSTATRRDPRFGARFGARFGTRTAAALATGATSTPTPTSMPAWTLADAEHLIERIRPLLDGLDCRVVGSVATRGRSDNDLDLLLVARDPETGGDVHAGEAAIFVAAAAAGALRADLGHPVELAGRDDAWFVPAVLDDGRLVEFHFGLALP
jgi:hypothetical protein